MVIHYIAAKKKWLVKVLMHKNENTSSEIIVLGSVQSHKGQVFSKILFGIFNSSKKRMKKFDLGNYYDTSGRLVFVHFLEEY